MPEQAPADAGSVTAQRIQERIADLTKRRDEFIIWANAEAAGFNHRIEELRALLEPPAVEPQPAVLPMPDPALAKE
jgi:hypothetical protein